jgi:CDP-diacylglycerol pyrophosphatase
MTEDAFTTLEATMDAVSVAHVTVGPDDYVILFADPTSTSERRQKLAEQIADWLGIPHDRFMIVGGGRSLLTVNVQETP